MSDPTSHSSESAATIGAGAGDVTGGAVAGDVTAGAVPGEQPAATGSAPDGPDGRPEGRGQGLLVREGDIAGDYLERLLDIADFDGDIDLDVENERAVVAIVGGVDELKALVGPNGATLDALQELTRLAVQQQTGVRSRLMLDIAGHRQGRRAELAALARRTAQAVLADGAAARLAPMNAFERKVVHDVVNDMAGVTSESEGVDPDRRVVISAEH